MEKSSNYSVNVSAKEFDLYNGGNMENHAGIKSLT